MEGRGHVDTAAVGLGQGADEEDPTADAARVEQLAGLGVGELLGHGAHARQHLVRRGEGQAEQVGPAGWRWERGGRGGSQVGRWSDRGRDSTASVQRRE